MKDYLKILFFLLLVQGSYAQNLKVAGHSSPVNGCKLSNQQLITVTINNLTALPVTAGEAIAHYNINGGGQVDEPLAGIGGNGSYTFTFFAKADLSACDQDFNIVVWVEYAIDINPSDNVISWTVRNDCDVVPGQIDSDLTVCKGDNNGTLVLNGWQYGILSDWSYSIDGGLTWNLIANSSGELSYTYNNLTTTTDFIIEYNGGLCGTFYTPITTITVQAPPVTGTINGPDSLCISSASGTLNLTGASAPVLDWESSIDGVTWSGIGNTTTTENFTSLAQTTMYRAQIDGGVCTNAYSDTFTVVISDLSVAGVLNNDSVFCGSGSLDLSLVSFSGDITGWESSSDGTSWNPIANTNDTYNTGTLTSSTYYRTTVKNGVCPVDISNQVFIEVQPALNAGNITGGGSFCESNATGILTLSGNSGNIVKWEESTNGGISWSDIANTSSTENYTNLSQTTWYRVLIDGGACANKYSDTAYVTVSPNTVAGILSADASICQGDSDSLYLSGNIGDIISWEYSNDGTAWLPTNTNDPYYILNSVQNSEYYRVIVKSGVCDEDTSNVIFITMLPGPVANAGNNVSIFPGDSIQLQGSGGLFGNWVPGSTLSDSTIYDPFAFPIHTTTYTLYVINADGCFDSDQVTVFVGGTLSMLDVKNVITANDDGYNDTWIIEGAEYFPEIEVKVYNIYGVLVYEDADYKNDWTGEYKGNILPDGTYLYIVMPGGTDAVLKGNLTILGGHE